MFKPAILLTLAAAVAAKYCQNITVPINISARNGLFNIDPPRTEIEVTNFFLNFSKENSNYTQSVTDGVSPMEERRQSAAGVSADAGMQYKTIKGDYQLAATYCEPDSGPGDALQILTHGVGFDRSYWDFPFDNYKYSYVNKAIDRGYSTLSWDRLGIGHSSHGDPVSEIQIFLEIAALKKLTQQVKDGEIRCTKHKFKKIVHLGHSFGSAITFALTNMYPAISDAIVLTGFSQVSSFIGLFALGGNFAPVREIPALKDQYVDGYVAPKTSIGMHINFFSPGDFDPRMLEAATATGQPAAVGELLTVGSTGSTSEFGGPVLVITGERDVPFCGGDCNNTMIIHGSAPNLIEMSKISFKKASVFNATIVPGAGHGLNFQYSSVFTYKAILDFLKSHL
ncbi:hypothetical protein TOPH_08614 [Tolypocladium ophioglossoides CBS 100239]|uniref:AB hydrolase-1 domain-containing protein n=1 Tax=Tolypocladium ophioglossoides (strain CBS 100239) TaxID=1163406 RepID=A0A0L0MY96_TOLOC|nr:hypothetical protein TOPH_08614 [Tolypocladium ophioglossoides CBS 100239]